MVWRALSAEGAVSLPVRLEVHAARIPRLRPGLAVLIRYLNQQPKGAAATNFKFSVASLLSLVPGSTCSTNQLALGVLSA